VSRIRHGVIGVADDVHGGVIGTHFGFIPGRCIDNGSEIHRRLPRSGTTGPPGHITIPPRAAPPGAVAVEEHQQAIGRERGPSIHGGTIHGRADIDRVAPRIVRGRTGADIEIIATASAQPARVEVKFQAIARHPREELVLRTVDLRTQIGRHLPWAGSGRTPGHIEITLAVPSRLAGVKIEPQTIGGDTCVHRPRARAQSPAESVRVIHGRVSGQYPGTSVRRGNWKLIRLHARNDHGTDRLELYNLRSDPGERKNLAAEELERSRELNALITKFLVDTEAVVPVRNPGYRGRSAWAILRILGSPSAHNGVVRGGRRRYCETWLGLCPSSWICIGNCRYDGFQ